MGFLEQISSAWAIWIWEMFLIFLYKLTKTLTNSTTTNELTYNLVFKFLHWRFDQKWYNWADSTKYISPENQDIYWVKQSHQYAKRTYFLDWLLWYSFFGQCYKTFYRRNWPSKLEFSLSKPFQPRLMFAGKSRSLPYCKALLGYPPTLD